MNITAIKAQNIQILNGFSSDRSYTNFATLELYKDLKGGPLYYFTDFKMSKNGYFEAYTEISKYWYITRNKLAITAQYNAGLNKDFQIQPTYLVGLSKAFVIKKTFNIQFDVMYRYQKELIVDDEWHNGYQITTTFGIDMKKGEILGYTDFWNTGYFILEPQGWYKATKNVYIGLEYRVSNYSPLESYQKYIMLGIKWNLEN
jgi:hypothetical protein